MPATTALEQRRRARAVALPFALLLLAGCVQSPGATLGPAAPAPHAPFETDVEMSLSVMTGPMPLGSMARAEAPVPDGATAVALRVEWSASTPASEALTAMLHAGAMAREGPMLAGAQGPSPLLTEPAFLPPNETSVVVTLMPRSEPGNAAVMQDARVRLEFSSPVRPPEPAKTYVDLVMDGPEGPWNVSLWDTPGARTSLLLIAGGGQARADWEPHALLLQQAGLRVMTTDGMRPRDHENATAAFDVLRGFGSPTLVIGGASLGAGAALRAAAAQPGCPAGLAELSPVTSQSEPTGAATALERYGDRPLFLGVSRGDALSYPESQQHRLLARGALTYVELEGDAHGTDVLSDGAALEAFTRWVDSVPPCAT